MKKLMILLALLSLFGCGSEEDSTGSRAPYIGNFVLSPNQVPTSDGEISTKASFFFMDLDLDIETLHVSWSNTLGDSGSFSTPIDSSWNSGTISDLWTTNTTTATTYEFEIYITDHTLLSSNTVTTALQVCEPYPCEK